MIFQIFILLISIFLDPIKSENDFTGNLSSNPSGYEVRYAERLSKRYNVQSALNFFKFNNENLPTKQQLSLIKRKLAMKFHPDVLSQNRQLTNEQVQVRTEYFKLLNEALSNIESFIEEKEKERLIAQEKNRRDTRPPNFHDPWKSDEKPQSRPSAHFDDLNMEDPWKEARNPGRRGPYYPSQEEFDMASRISKMENVKEAYEYLKPMLESSNGVEELKRRLYRSMMLRSQGLDSVEALKVNVLFMHMEKAVDNVNHYLEEQNRKKMESLKKIPVSQYYRYGGLGLRKPLPMRYSAFHR